MCEHNRAKIFFIFFTLILGKITLDVFYFLKSSSHLRSVWVFFWYILYSILLCTGTYFRYSNASAVHQMCLSTHLTNLVSLAQVEAFQAFLETFCLKLFFFIHDSKNKKLQAGKQTKIRFRRARKKVVCCAHRQKQKKGEAIDGAVGWSGEDSSSSSSFPFSSPKRQSIGRSTSVTQRRRRGGRCEDEGTFHCCRSCVHNHQRWYAKWKLSRNMNTLRTRFCTLCHRFACSAGAYYLNFCVGAHSEVY